MAKYRLGSCVVGCSGVRQKVVVGVCWVSASLCSVSWSVVVCGGVWWCVVVCGGV